MVKYTKKIDEKISSFEKSSFSPKHKKIDSIFLKFHFEIVKAPR